jgi:hypothetical protein
MEYIINNYNLYKQKMFKLINCPICNICAFRTKIFRHLMNKKDFEHLDFLKKQIELIKYLSNFYNDYIEICLRNDIFSNICPSNEG